MTEATIRILGDVTTIVGEAPLWSAAEQALYWIDGQRRQAMRLRDGVTEIRELPYRPSCLAWLPEGRLLVGYKKGIGSLDFDSGAARQFALGPEVDLGEVGFNDGACDPAGRFWIGTRHAHASEPLGALYRFDAAGRVARMRGGLTVSNGLAFAQDGRLLYQADSRPGRIHVHEVDPATGGIGAARLLVDYEGLGRRPDGCTLDEEGCLWVAEIDGWRVARYAPDGARLAEIMLPVRKPASVCFGGPDMATLFVTTISYGLDEAEAAAQPAAGRVLALRPGVRGLPEPVCRVGPWAGTGEAT